LKTLLKPDVIGILISIVRSNAHTIYLLVILRYALVCIVGIPRVTSFGFGRIVLDDGTVIVLRVAIVNVKKAEGFSPFGGVNLSVKVVGGVGTISVPEELRKTVADKPLAPPGALPKDGWEYIEIKEQEPAFEQVEVEVDGRKFIVRVEAEATMVVRNLTVKTDAGEPLYVVNWAYKIKWRPVGD
jgi:hypothetical protein